MNDSNTRSQFFIIWCGQLTSSIGSGLTAFALGIYAFDLTGSATIYSLILFAAFLPSLLLKPIGGTLADRMNRKLLMMIGDLGSALGVLFIIIMMLLHSKGFWAIYLGTMISSIFVALQNPAYKASITDLVSQEFYSKASGLIQLAESSRFLLAPIIAGFLFTLIDIKAILFLDVLSFIIAILTTLYVKNNAHDSKARPETHFHQDLLAGFRYLCKHAGIMWLISIISVVTFFIGLLQALLGPMILSFSNAQTFGIVQTLMTTGMLIGSVFISLFGKADKKIPILSISLFLSGLFFACIGLKANIVLITVFGFLFFLSLPLVNTSLDVLVRSNVDNKMQGRIWSIVSLISQAGMAIALGIGGYLADHILDPLLQVHGSLAHTIGIIIGIGPARGIGLLFILSGLLVACIAIFIGKLQILKPLDNPSHKTLAPIGL